MVAMAWSWGVGSALGGGAGVSYAFVSGFVGSGDGDIDDAVAEGGVVHFESGCNSVFVAVHDVAEAFGAMVSPWDACTFDIAVLFEGLFEVFFGGAPVEVCDVEFSSFVNGSFAEFLVGRI